MWSGPHQQLLAYKFLYLKMVITLETVIALSLTIDILTLPTTDRIFRYCAKLLPPSIVRFRIGGGVRIWQSGSNFNQGGITIWQEVKIRQHRLSVFSLLNGGWGAIMKLLKVYWISGSKSRGKKKRAETCDKKNNEKKLNTLQTLAESF